MTLLIMTRMMMMMMMMMMIIIIIIKPIFLKLNLQFIFPHIVKIK
jgi:hypothetical protein